MKNTKNRFGLIFRFSKNAEAYFAVVIIASLAATVLNALVPKIFSFTVDRVLADDGIVWFKQRLWVLALAVIAIAMLYGFSIFLYRTYTAKGGETFAKNMRDMLFIHVQRLPMSWHSAHSTGDIIQRCTADVETIRTFVTNQVMEVFRTVFLFAVSLAMMLSMNVKLTVIALIFSPIIVLYSVFFYSLIGSSFQKADEAEGELSTVVQENATGVRVVRAFGRERYETDRFDEKNEKYASLWIRLGTISGLYWGVGDFIAGLQVIAVIVFGAIEAVNGEITAGQFIAFASYNTTLVWPIRSLGRILSEMSKAGVSFDRVNYILDAAEEDMEHGGELPKHHDISFENVSFGYREGQKVLDNISFEIGEGKTFGILGGTGSGKSTLVHLLDRLYQTDKGSIKIGGVDIKSISRSQLRREIGLVLQEPFLFSRTIKENIASAKPDATMEEIREAAKIACIDDAICAFPDGYDTIVGERGVTLSGGQRQRVAIARMLLTGAPILVFDDSLSAVDAETDMKIRHALRKTMKNATVIIISHRITTLMEADEIMVLNHGKVAETGTHEQLVSENGIYRRIYDIQMNLDDMTLLGGEG